MKPLDLSRAATSRRGFLGTAGAALAAAGIARADEPPAAATPPGGVHVAGSDEIKAALIGCGGRGGGAIVDAFQAPGGRVTLTAMADVFPERISAVKRSLGEQFKDRVNVPDDRTFIGFDAYRQAIEALPAGGIAIFATPPAFRAAHFAHAIEKGVHVFMEKPVSIDGPSTKRIIELAAQADAKNLKVAVGLMCRHCDRRIELLERLRAGEAGDLITFRGYRNQNPSHNLDLAPGPKDTSELLWQVKRFHNFLWASGGIFSDYCIHHIDEVAMMKGAWPVTADAIGGRHNKGKITDQNFDVYAIDLVGHGYSAKPDHDYTLPLFVDHVIGFMDALKLVDIANNLGDAKSMVTHPATTTHMRVGAEERAKLGITDGTVRLSVGLEDVADLIDDLAEALDAAAS